MAAFSGDNGTTWSDISSNLSYRADVQAGHERGQPCLVLTGWQDNGTSRWSSTGWTQVMGGDGMECFVDRSNNNIMYGEYYNGDFSRSTNGGASFSDIRQSISENGAWVTPWCQDPTNPATL